MPSISADKEKRFKAVLDSQLKPGKKLDAGGANTVIAKAQEGGLTEAKAHVLRTWIARHEDAFDPSAKDALASFVTKKMPSLVAPEPETGGRSGAGEPALTSSDKNATWTSASGKLADAATGVDEDDPRQGDLGDCYLISALSSLAATRPNAIRDAVKANADGTYTVTFHENADWKGPSKAVKVTVDGKLPEAGGRPVYATDKDSGELWPMIIEKAYAKWKGSYDREESGYPGDALSALTGTKPKIIEIEPSEPGALFKQLQSLTASKKPITCYTHGEANADLKRADLVQDHAYSVLGVVDSGGKQLVKLRNPWGDHTSAHGDEFTLPIEDFAKCFDFVDYVD